MLRLFAVLLLCSSAALAQAVARVQGVSGGYPVAVTGGSVTSTAGIVVFPSGASASSTKETPACGASPCVLNTTSTVVLNIAPTRYQCLLQNVGTVPVYCSQGIAVSSTAFEFQLKAATATSTGDGLPFNCSMGPGIWRGSINYLCYATSTGCSLGVSAAGY